MGRSKRKKKEPPTPDVARMERQLIGLSGEWRNLCRKLNNLEDEEKLLDSSTMELYYLIDSLRWETLHEQGQEVPLESEYLVYKDMEAQLDIVCAKLKAALVQKQTLETRISSALESYGEVTCRSLCDKIRMTLPREMRDLIYGYIFEGQRVAVDHHGSGCKCLSCQDPYGAGPSAAKVFNRKALPLAHLRDPGYTGELVDELGEIWYRQSTFVFDTCGSIAAFFGSNVWNERVLPQALIKLVEARIDLADIFRPDRTVNIQTRVTNLEKSLDVLWTLGESTVIDFVFETTKTPLIRLSLLKVHLRCKSSLRKLDDLIYKLRREQSGCGRNIQIHIKHDWDSTTLQTYFADNGLCWS